MVQAIYSFCIFDIFGFTIQAHIHFVSAFEGDVTNLSAFMDREVLDKSRSRGCIILKVLWIVYHLKGIYAT